MNHDEAMFSPAFPCNPRPFARALDSLCDGNTGAIKSDKAKRILWILMAQAYGEPSRIDLSDEWKRLYKEFCIAGGSPKIAS